MRILRLLVLSLLFFGVLFASCKKKEVKKVITKKVMVMKKADIKPTSPKIKDVNEKFKGQIQKVVQDYLTLKDALVKDDKGIAQTAAKSGLTNLALVDNKLLNKPISNEVWKKQKPIIEKFLNTIAKDTTVALQRKNFKDLSESMISIVENFGLNQKIMIQHCPMADANWMSTYNTIRNPYFGDKDLSCGETTKIIK